MIGLPRSSSYGFAGLPTQQAPATAHDRRMLVTLVGVGHSNRGAASKRPVRKKFGHDARKPLTGMARGSGSVSIPLSGSE